MVKDWDENGALVSHAIENLQRKGLKPIEEARGPKLMRSVIPMRSCHGRAIHPTEKPVELLSILICTSTPRGG